MLNTDNYKRNASQNNSQYHLTPVRMAIIKKSTNNRDSSGSPVVKNPPSSAGDTGSMPVCIELPSLCATTKTRHRQIIFF